MEIRYINQSIPAGVPTVIPVGGRYFRVIGNTNPFVLEVGFNGQFKAKIEDAVTGDAGKVSPDREPFTALRITTTGTETVKIIVTDGEIWRDSANLDVSDRAARLLGIVYGNLGQLHQTLNLGANMLAALPYGDLGVMQQVAVGNLRGQLIAEIPASYAYSNFQSTTLLTALTSEQAIAPASNTNAMIIWRAESRDSNGTAVQNRRFQAHTAAPNSLSVGDQLAQSRDTSAAGIFAGFVQLHRQWIPSGKGFYTTGGATEGSGSRIVVYTLL